MQLIKLYIVYDFINSFPNFFYIILGLLLAFSISIKLYYYYKRVTHSDLSSIQKIKERAKGLLIWGVIAWVTGLLLLFLTPIKLYEYINLRIIYNNKQYTIIEGIVENYHPMPKDGHDRERFDVNGVHFDFSDFDSTDFGYNNTVSYGGAIKDSLYVRIGFYNNGEKNVILKLEVEKKPNIYNKSKESD